MAVEEPSYHGLLNILKLRGVQAYQGFILFFAIVVVLVSILIDLVYVLIDPCITYQ